MVLDIIFTDCFRKEVELKNKHTRGIRLKFGGFSIIDKTEELEIEFLSTFYLVIYISSNLRH